jgi:hypothetical protein
MKQFLRRQGMLWIGRRIPIEDAKWIGGLLAQLKHEQLAMPSAQATTHRK